jgi:hypothetical protein
LKGKPRHAYCTVIRCLQTVERSNTFLVSQYFALRAQDTGIIGLILKAPIELLFTGGVGKLVGWLALKTVA